MRHKITVSGVGCCLVDILYNDISFSSESIKPYLSQGRGDGGLTPGMLVFREEFEKYCGKPFGEVLANITGGRPHSKINIGGPSIVSLINLAQLACNDNCEVRFYGRVGNDSPGGFLLSALNKMPVVLRNYKISEKDTPSTVVLSDPSWDDGNGERMFINSIGAAWDFMSEDLDDDFFDSDIVVFGGTALVPNIHDNLTSLLKKARARKAVTIVNTVFDFRSEKNDPLKRWPLGESDESYGYIDLLITDKEEALRLSGAALPEEAVEFFIGMKVSSFIITDGARDIAFYSDGKLFRKIDVTTLPVSQRITEELARFPGGDTTGCGDNFTGGIIASLVDQMTLMDCKPDLREACIWGIVSGGFTCFYVGGTYLEKNAGEKLRKIQPYYELYKHQMQ
ncbi:MAG: carbohydrate kinase family protein [Bacteroidales bacterium]|jgi:sugar/nucleoside kinase (ribokinase family)|nr:carbohydrate kinase family protein [Bacteroidales bacterium]